MSIKLKVAILNTIFMTLIVILVLIFLIVIGNNLIDINIKAQLKDVVEYNAEKIEYENKVLNFKELDLYKKEVYSYIYSEEGILLSSYKSDIPNIDISLINETLSIDTIENTQYYIYDLLLEYEEGDKFWIRGITVADDESQVVSTVFKIAFITLPIIVLIAGIGCYYISKKSFMPIQKIIDTAKLIKQKEDLSFRTNLASKTDEVYTLAKIFDEMIASIENLMEIEKQFSSDVSHELRTPVSVILAQCEYALDENSSIEEKQLSLEVIQRQSIKMKKLITNLLNISKMDNGIEKINKQKINLSELVLIICEEQQLIKQNDIELNFDIQKNIYANVDNDLIIRLITNLINNAYKYGKKYGNIDIKLIKKEEKIYLNIKDNGIGIDKKDLEKIWNRFYQVETSRTNSNGSMGLGLYMVRKIIKLHDAKITVESQIDKGTCFEIIFN